MGEGENYGKIIGKIIEMILNGEKDHNEILMCSPVWLEIELSVL